MRVFVNVLLTLFAFTLSAAAVADKATTYELDIEAQALPGALKSFAEQTDLQVVYFAAIAEGKHAPAVEGELTADAALGHLLADANLGYQVVDERTYSIAPEAAEIQRGDSDSKNASPAPVLMAQNQQTTNRSPLSTDNRRDDNAEDTADTELEEIIVVGTSIRGVDPVGSPVVTIDREDIEKSGVSTLQAVFRRIPQNYGGGANEITSNAPGARNNSQFNNGRGSGLNLRGLGTESTLTLVNGRRVTQNINETIVDVSTIPLSIIEKVEILTDGASAIYGSDAVAGVVNVVLRNDYEGIESQVRYGSVSDGDRDEIQFSQLFGWTWSTGSSFFAYDFLDQSALFSADRAFAATDDLRSFGGDDFRRTSSNPGTLLAGGETFALPFGQDGTNLDATDVVAGTVNLGNRREGTTILDERTQHSAFWALTQDITNRAEFFLEARYTNRESEDIGQSEIQTLTITPTNPYFFDPIGGLASVQVQYSFVDDFVPVSDRSVDATNVVAGLDIEVAPLWQFEFFGAYSEESIEAKNVTRNSVLLAEALGNFDDPSTPTVDIDNPATAYDPFVDGFFNPFGDGGNSSVAVSRAIAGYTSGDSTAELWTANATVDGALFPLEAGDVKVALGMEYRDSSLESRRENFVTFAQPTVVPSVLPDGKGRDVFAAFGELYLPIFSEENTAALARELTLSLALRYDDYSDFGSTTNPKFGALWSPVDWMTLRGSYGTSFRAPSLRELDPDFNRALAFVGVPDPTSPSGVANSLIFFGNDPELGPEESTTWTLGFEISLKSIPDFKTEVTYFNIEYENRITPLSEFFFSALANEDRLASIIDRDPDDVTVAGLLADPELFNFSGIGNPTPADVDALIDLRTTNLAVTKLDGIDFEVTYGFDTNVGRFDLSAYLSHYFDYTEALSQTSPETSVLDLPGRPVDWRMRNSLSWSSGHFVANLAMNYLDGYTDNESTPNRSISSYTTYDLTFAINLDETFDSGFAGGTVLTLSAINLFDEDPPFFNNNDGVAFDPEKSNPRGRFIALQIAKRW